MKTILLSLMLAASCLAQDWQSTLLVSWDPNTDEGLAGYEVRVGRSSGVYDQFFRIGLETSHQLPNLTDGNWYIAVAAYNIEGEFGENSDELIVLGKMTEFQYSFDGITWETERTKLMFFTDKYDYQLPSKRILTKGSSPKLYRYLYLEDGVPESITVSPSEGQYLQWDIPYPTDSVSSFKVYKKEGNVWTPHGSVEPFTASFKINVHGEYAVSAVNLQKGEGPMSNPVTVYTIPDPPTNLQVKVNAQ